VKATSAAAGSGLARHAAAVADDWAVAAAGLAAADD
jgi:hypothetical protein